MKRITITKFLPLIFLLAGICAKAQVTSSADDGSAGTLRSVIAAAAPNATISIAQDVTNITLVSGQITIDKSITISGNGQFATTVNANANTRIFNIITGDVTLNAMMLTNGLADNGGAIQVIGANLFLNSVFITNSVANGASGSGGAIMVGNSATLTAVNCQFNQNIANRAGGAIESVAGTTVNLTNVQFNSNNAGLPPATAAPGNGGAFHITGNGNANLIGTTAYNNMAAQEGGGLWNGAGTMTINQSSMLNNVAKGAAADDGGGGLFNNAGTVNITGSFFSANLANGTSGSGGGIFSLAGSVSLNNCGLDSNSANRAGGAIEAVDGTLTLIDDVFILNNVDGTAGTPNPGNGGAIHISGITNASLSGCVVQANDARREGGGLWNQTGSTMTVDNTVIHSNTASGPDATHGGGGIFNNGGTLTVTRTTLWNNRADGTAGNGGGIHVKSGTVSVMRSTVSDNLATASGGGIYNNANLSVNATTIAENTAATGGGIADNSSAAAIITNTIVATNTAPTGSDVSSVGVFASNGYNLIGTDTTNAFTPATGDLEGVNPLLGSLSDNGGFTLTYALLTGSPAYNAGNPVDLFNDQRNNGVFGGRRDIGAYESQFPLLGVAQNTINPKRSAIHPNPANGILNIEFTSVPIEASGSIIEVASGKTVAQFRLDSPSNRIDVGAYAAGVYLVKLVSDGFHETHKLVIGR
jgi:hypothetical protein